MRLARLLAALEAPLTIQQMEQIAIRAALRRCIGSVGRAAKQLGIGRATLYRRLAELDLAVAS